MSGAEKVGVLLMAYGAAQSPEEIGPYLSDIRGGRTPSAELIQEITHRYELIGGKSPLLEITRRQADALEECLNRGQPTPGFQVYVGMRHWHPYIQETVARMAQDGVRKGIALCLTPYYSKLSVGAYFEKLAQACTALSTEIEWAYVESWNDHPLFVRALVTKTTEALLKFDPAERASVPILFSAHSLPTRIIEEKDPYPHELEETVEAVMKLVGNNDRHFAYQSQGRTAEPWLGPDAGDVIEKLSRAGYRQVLMAPIGFISDHMETLYDVDILYRKRAESLGIGFSRTESLNTSPLLIEALADIVQKNLHTINQ